MKTVQIKWLKFHPLSAACVGMIETVYEDYAKPMIEGGYAAELTEKEAKAYEAEQKAAKAAEGK